MPENMPGKKSEDMLNKMPENMMSENLSVIKYTVLF